MTTPWTAALFRSESDRRGLIVRAIGEKLYLSHRTVAGHPYRLFPKLGITSRNQPSILRPVAVCLIAGWV